ncbi:hypothetical protein [Streptomyces sp. GS7]|uniref:hypothetical protein n=1 Tax=Streptomyces sp. GS7 TaxID=2692234 RepID=UPI001319066C|nr:hypothetical protein [Streptomyces sp. GS7]QHC26352.1 hypothetical protein GR130_38290 [Streptomyces sp. GS7]
MGHPAGAPIAGTANYGDLEKLAVVLRLITNGGELDTLLRKLDTTLHVGYEEAARRLQIPEFWLRKRINSLPHRKMGKHVVFADDDLRAISAMHAVRPGERANSANAAHGTAIATLTPSQRSRPRSRA